MMNIPYCYEVPLYLKGYGYVKPDFKVLNVSNKERVLLGTLWDDG